MNDTRSIYGHEKVGGPVLRNSEDVLITPHRCKTLPRQCFGGFPLVVGAEDPTKRLPRVH